MHLDDKLSSALDVQTIETFLKCNAERQQEHHLVSPVQNELSRTASNKLSDKCMEHWAFTGIYLDTTMTNVEITNIIKSHYDRSNRTYWMNPMDAHQACQGCNALLGTRVMAKVAHDARFVRIDNPEAIYIEFLIQIDTK
jgi:hypothetical protein